MLNIKIDAKTQNYILKTGGIITIDNFKTGRCWVSVAMPGVRFGEPESISNFNLYKKEGISIYISKSLELSENTIHIQFNSFLFFKSLNVYGFKIL